MRRLPVERLGALGERLPLGRESSHHALHVLRLPRGAELLLFDGTGQEQPARLVDAADGAAFAEVTGPISVSAPSWPLHAVLALTKGPAMDLAVRMATEAGATHVHPVLTRRSVPRGDRGDRWDRIALGAARQCGRADVPEVSAVRPLVEALAALPPGLDLRVGVPGAPALERATGPAGVVVGPEGGLTDDEVARCLAAGARAMGLGAWVLRADTAAAVAVALTAPVG